MTDPVIVLGGTLAGMAAAARLAKAGHPVELLEPTGTLGGRWAAYELDDTGLLVDDAPGVLGFPAPWRDLFRKSGRPLEAELARAGHALVPAGPEQLVFADGRQLSWPSDRGEQFATLSAAWGRPVAERWRDLVDGLDDVRQALRPLGQELELDRRRLTRAVRRELRHRASVADVAGSLGHDQLGALVRSVAYRRGSVPEQTPALVATDLSVDRKFGRWHLAPGGPAPKTDVGRSSVLVEALVARLALRKVVVRLGVPVTGLVVHDGAVTGVVTAAGPSPAAAVISTLDPWTLYTDVLPRQRRRLRGLRPAAVPRVSHTLVDQPSTEVAQTTRLSADGVPVITYDRPAGNHTLRSVHDFGAASPSPDGGLADRGFRGWARRPPTSSDLAGLYLAGPFSAAGPSPSAVILSGALASYAAHDRVSDRG